MQQAPEAMTLKVIAHIHTAFPTKFGIPRQSGLVEELRGEIVFTPEYRSFPAQCGKAGPLPCARRALAAIPGWAYSPPGHPSGRTRWDFPA